MLQDEFLDAVSGAEIDVDSAHLAPAAQADYQSLAEHRMPNQVACLETGLLDAFFLPKKWLIGALDSILRKLLQEAGGDGEIGPTEARALLAVCERDAVFRARYADIAKPSFLLDVPEFLIHPAEGKHAVLEADDKDVRELEAFGGM